MTTVQSNSLFKIAEQASIVAQLQKQLRTLCNIWLLSCSPTSPLLLHYSG